MSSSKNKTGDFTEVLGQFVFLYDEDYEAGREWLLRDEKGRFISVSKLVCPRCGRKETKEGHDACLGTLPGVKNACCGHGVTQGYIEFENGVTIRGVFEVE